MLVSDLFPHVNESQALDEMPIDSFTTLGDWSKNSSFRHEQDRKLLTNPKAQAKIIHKWRNVVVPFNMYFVNSPEANRHTEVGMVDAQWFQREMPKTFQSLEIRSDAVNMIFTNNKGTEREPMTAWVMAHRFGHCVKRMDDWDYIQKTIERMTNEIMHKVYRIKSPGRYDFEKRAGHEKVVTRFYEIIGTFKSARDSNIRSHYEFYYELLAQYMTTGRIKFNPLPDGFGHGRMAWGKYTNYARKDQEIGDYDHVLRQYAEELESDFDSLLHSCVGKIFVM